MRFGRPHHVIIRETSAHQEKLQMPGLYPILAVSTQSIIVTRTRNKDYGFAHDALTLLELFIIRNLHDMTNRLKAKRSEVPPIELIVLLG